MILKEVFSKFLGKTVEVRDASDERFLDIYKVPYVDDLNTAYDDFFVTLISRESDDKIIAYVLTDD